MRREPVPSDMARHLYTIAAVSPAMQRALNELLSAPHVEIEAAERKLLAAVASDQPLVAFFRMLLDGWDRAHAALPAPISADLDRMGWVWILDPVNMPKEVDTTLLNDRSRAALLVALHDASAFIQSSSSAVIVLWRSLQASFDDRDFGPGTMRMRLA